MGEQLSAALGAALGLADAALDDLRRRLRKLLAAEGMAAERFLAELARLLARYEPVVGKAVWQAVVRSWLRGQADVAAKVPALPEVAPEAAEWVGPVLAEVGRQSPFAPAAEVSGIAPAARFPLVEEAAGALARRAVLTPEALARYTLASQAKAFTVGEISSADAAAKIRDALADNVLRGGTLRDFGKDVDAALGKSALAPHRVEAIYRLWVMRAYSEGQLRVLAHPLVRSEFPYCRWFATHDSRVRDDHLAMEKAGIQGTDVYRTDDPEILRVWPPASWNCRCRIVLITLEMAAGLGIEEAQTWLRTGRPPLTPAWVPPVPLTLPAGWESPALA